MRVSLWPHYETEGNDLAQFIKTLNEIRRVHGFGHKGMFVTSDLHGIAGNEDTLSFLRGNLLVVLTNRGGGSGIGAGEEEDQNSGLRGGDTTTASNGVFNREHRYCIPLDSFDHDAFWSNACDLYVFC